MSYRVAIDTSVCCGYGGCVRVARTPSRSRTGSPSCGSVVEAADACPLGAITVEEAPGLAA